MNPKIAIKPFPENCLNLLVYYVFDSDLYEQNQVTKKEAVAEVYVTVTVKGQKLERIDILNNVITENEVLELAKKSINNLLTN
jgi:hypothetical protein